MEDTAIRKSLQVLINRYQSHRNLLGIESSEIIPPEVDVAQYNVWNKVIGDLKQVILIIDKEWTYE